MNYKNVERMLLTSVKEDDPSGGFKELEIKRWCSAYQTLLSKWERTIFVPLLKEILEDELCWQISDLGYIKLNRYIIGQKLLALKTADGQKKLIGNFERYIIACWCCFEDEIRAVFEEFKLTLGSESVENLVRRLNKGALMMYWSHAMNNQEYHLELNNEHPYVYAFRCAMIEKHVEALEFFWHKLQSIDSISLEKKEDLLMQAAYNAGNFSADDAGMVDFCLRYLHEDKYRELLKKDFKQNKHHYTLSMLTGGYSFESAKKLFEHLGPEGLSIDEYSTLMFGALDSIVSVPDDSFIKSGSDMLTSIWNRPGFEAHRQHYLHGLSVRLSSRDLIVRLIKENKAVKVLSEVINSLSQEQMQSIMELDESEYEVFTRVRNKQLDGRGDSQLPGSLLDIETLQEGVIDTKSKV